MTLRKTLVLLAATLLGAAVLSAGPSPRVVIESPPELADVSRRIQAEIESGDFGIVLSLTGQVGFLHPIRVVVVPESAPLARSTPSWISGFARGERGLIVLFPERVPSYPDRNLTALLTHEVAHVMVARAARGNPVPRWFNEGVATVAAREWGLEDRARYALAVVGRGASSVAELDEGFRVGGKSASRSYALSAALVRWMRGRHGEDVTARILGRIGSGEPFDSAILHATGTPLRRIEHLFFEREAFWTTWVPFLTSSVALWMAITALAIVAGVRRRRRRTELMERWEREEEAASRPVETIH